MADFRRCVYALALVALLAGLTVSASAQAFQCNNGSGVPPLVRTEGYTELQGDIVLDCTGGIPTPPNQPVPAVNIQVNLDVNFTAKTTAVVNNVEFVESLIMIDEPNSAANPAVGILNCGQTNAPDGTQANAGVCSILGGGSTGAQNTYNGTVGHPNVFQGRSLRIALGSPTSNLNQVVFSGVPIDPPGTQCANPVNGQCHRIIRITNIRADATSKQPSGNSTPTISANLIINPSAGLPVENPVIVVSRVQFGLIPPVINTSTTTFIQCSSLQSQSQGLAFTFKEGFNNAFKPMSLTQVLLNGFAKTPVTGGYSYNNGLAPNTSQAINNNQNVPGAVYDTESGFTNSLPASGGDCPTNALTGTNCNANNTVFNNTGGTTALGIASAGTATQGTRLIMRFSAIPTGASISVPNIVNLTNVVGGLSTGVAVLINGTLPSGSGGNPAAPGAACAVTVPPTSGCTALAIPTTGASAGTAFAVYEVFFANPSALEQLVVPLLVSGNPNLPLNQPSPTTGPPAVPALIQGGFAPFYDPGQPIQRTALALGTESIVGTNPNTLGPATLAVPRFAQQSQPQTLFNIVRCSCNLLFPYVTGAKGFGSGDLDTGMAIANTSRDPGAAFGFIANAAQSGPVQLWYYNRNNATAAAEPSFYTQGNTQCTNATLAGSCSGTLAPVLAGGMLTMTLVSGGYIMNDLSATGAGPQVLLPVGAGIPGGAFQGYIIAQASFQYCHGFAFISKAGSGFSTDNMAMGYQAIVLDPTGIPRTASVRGENDGH